MLNLRVRYLFFLIFSICIVAFTVVWFGNSVFIALESKAPSLSIGTVGHGTLKNGKRIPSSGPNFRAYSRFCTLLGRNSVHSKVRSVLLKAYGILEETDPELTFVYGEASKPKGGPMFGHQTHMNGLSVDFMVPIRDSEGKSISLPTSFWTNYGYDLEFDSKGRLGEFQIDFEAMARHLDALQRTAREHGFWVEYVVLNPEYLPLLLNTPTGRSLSGKFPFWRKPITRHDEHYHVDFSNPEG